VLFAVAAGKMLPPSFILHVCRKSGTHSSHLRSRVAQVFSNAMLGMKQQQEQNQQRREAELMAAAQALQEQLHHVSRESKG
jgi:hypothetical protein